MIEALVVQCTRRPWLTIVVAALITAACLYLTVTRFAINTDTARLIAPDVAWRQDEIAYDAAFPQSTDLIVAVVDADTPEQADAAAAALAGAAAKHPESFRTVRRPDSSPFFDREGLLLLSKPELDATLVQLNRARGLIGPVAADPTLRGLMAPLQTALDAVRAKVLGFDALVPITGGLADTFERVLDGKPAALSWQRLLAQGPDAAAPARKLVLLQPVLDFNDLQPGGPATDALRGLVGALNLTPDHGVRVRLTGPVPLGDEEFATVAENAGLNTSLTVLVIAIILFLALRSGRVIAAVLITLFAGLIVTAGIGLVMVGELNLISVAFMILFIGLGVDFGIQIAVRYRAERFVHTDLRQALRGTAHRVGGSLTLAAVSLVAGFFSFLPTNFRGVSELGLIAGVGMVIAYVMSLTLLPALLMVLRPPVERRTVETRALATVDHWIADHRKLVLALTALVVLAGVPFLIRESFDSNPMNLRSAKVESVATFLDLSRDPDTSPNALSAFAPNVADLGALAARLEALPEVQRTVSLATFIPADQDEKLAAIRAAAARLLPALSPAETAPPPTDAETVAALHAAATAFAAAAKDDSTPGGAAARRFAAATTRLADAAPERRAAAQAAVTAYLPGFLTQLRTVLAPEPITRATLPADLVSDWVAKDGRARIEIFPKGDANDNAVIARFVAAVRAVAPHATGAPITIIESGRTVIDAFITAGLLALAAIFVILVVALRRPKDVALTLGPLILAGIMSLEAASLFGIPLNFANIIALPLMFGVGVAFHIYYVVAWRAGVADMLASSLTRAIFFSALTTGTAFGSLCFSSHPGTASMGKLLAISLFFTLLAAFVIVPAFLGPPPDEDTRTPSALAH